MEKETITLFVYGGLLKGMTLSPFIESAKYLGPGYIKAKIFFLGQFPGIVEGNDKVFGELYELNVSDLPGLDKIEDYHPENNEASSYVRKETEVTILPDGKKIKANAYFYNRPIKKEHIYIAHGDYRRFILEEENENCWIVPQIIGAEKREITTDFSGAKQTIEGAIQLIDIKQSNGKFSLKREKVKIIELPKSELKKYDVLVRLKKSYLSFSVPIEAQEGKVKVAFVLFKVV